MFSTDYTAHEDLAAANELRAEIRAALQRTLAGIKPDAPEISVGADRKWRGSLVRRANAWSIICARLLR